MLTTTRTIVIRRLSFGSLLKLLVLGNTVAFTTLSFVIGLLAAAGCEGFAVSFHDEPLTGASAILASPLIGLGLGACLGFGCSLSTAFGLALLFKYRPLKIKCAEVDPTRVPGSG